MSSLNYTLEEYIQIFKTMLEMGNASQNDSYSDPQMEAFSAYVKNKTGREDWMTVVQEGINDLKQTYRVSASLSTVLIVLYVTVMAFGLLGNASIVWACVTSKVKRTARNIFVMHMAISGIMLCSFTMPMTLLDLIYKYWVFGNTQAGLCFMMGPMQSTCIFFSTYSVVLIAIDRYLYIVRSSMTQISTLQCWILGVVSLLVSFLMSCPLLITARLKPVFKDVSKCGETWENSSSRTTYTIVCTTLQYIIPCIIVFFAYLGVCRTFNKTSARMSANMSSFTRTRQIRRRARTNRFLILVSVVFFFSWTPLNCFNIFDLFYPNFLQGQSHLLVYTACHLIGMSSSCTNPILYGFLNENFSQMFNRMPTICRVYKGNQPTNRQGEASTSNSQPARAVLETRF